jgi:3-oxoacyl-[acyl-carrier-protein] synthase-3
MRGPDVYRHALERMSDLATAALDARGWELKDVDRLVAHQANARITAALAARLDFPLDQCASNIAKVGNTVAASIPVLLAEAAEEGFLVAGHRVLLTAFGAGLTWGATTLVWPDLKLAQHDDDGERHRHQDKEGELSLCTKCSRKFSSSTFG